jgi:arsenite methyltransferase
MMMQRKQVLKAIVRAEYGQAALQAHNGRTSCCGTGVILEPGKLNPITAHLYGEDQKSTVPSAALRASLGCGNPTALASIRPGETVLDLGSGGGMDVLLSAQRVGPDGKVYGLDMTDEMLALARDNQSKAGVTNVEFLRGEIEQIPLPDESVDVIISNCVINLSPDKDAVLAESFRVLKPGGRFAVSDVVVRGEIPAEIRHSLELWCGCVAGALTEGDYVAKLARAGFDNISIEATRIYGADDAREFLIGAGLNLDAVAPRVDGQFFSGFVRAYKPLLARSPSAGSRRRDASPIG